ncbi:MAG: response regulator [Desulfamplus sp.]|nr:response regulator [Desulfamplus sp.]
MTISILIVDDNMDLRKAAEKFLIRAGYSTRSVSSAEEALEILEETTNMPAPFKADIVLTDIEMAGMDGLELTKIIKERYRIRVIVMTGTVSAYVYEDAIRAGADSFIFKPFGYHDLTMRVKKVEEEIVLRSQLCQICEERKRDEAASRAKSELLAMMCHEISIPVNEVSGLTNNLLNTGLTLEQQRYTALIQSNTESLTKVVNKMLDYSRAQNSQFDRLFENQKKTAHQSSMPDSPVTYDKEEFVRTISNTSSVEKMMLRFVKSLPAWIEALSNLIKKGDIKSFAQHAHSLSKVAANFNMTAISDSALRLEKIVRECSDDKFISLEDANAALGQLVRQIEILEVDIYKNRKDGLHNAYSQAN